MQYVTSGGSPVPSTLSLAALTSQYPPGSTAFGLVTVATDVGPVWNRGDIWAAIATGPIIGQLLFNALNQSEHIPLVFGWA